MSLWVKICGLTSTDAVRAAVGSGADAVGFVFHAASTRHLEPAAAAALARTVPSGVATVIVTRHPSQADVASILAAFTPDFLQTDDADLAGLELPAGLATLPVLRTGGVSPAVLPARCLYEASESGRGATADWSAAADFARRTQLVLAGGLTPDNVAAAIHRVRPFGVDVSSGVESAPGIKDLRKIENFVAAARAAIYT